MGGGGAEIKSARKLRLMCLHGFRTSGEIIRKQLTAKWPESVLDKLELVFADAPFPCQGKSQEFTEYVNFDECLAYIEDYMIKHGPFDGLLGFSQGAILSVALAGMQANGVALTRVPKIKLVLFELIDYGKFVMLTSSRYTLNPISSYHRDQDFLKEYGTELLDSFVDPVVIRHPNGHTIPRFDEEGLKSMLTFLERMQKEVIEQKQEISLQNDDVEECLI
ncbi:hypothetical protein SASPL_150317 [Salvia splendens]|uniref:Serine hydrolase domain-containing protein n=1 Tax=Salvia splendens TaxID=180675 RepID=A0A8X8W6J9_SALSN|nr:hypothetical protein SASPL_150317 [Salvia splendens]